MNEQILNRINGWDTLEFLRQRKDNGQNQMSSCKIRRLSAWNMVAKRETLSNAVSLYHTVSRAGKRYFTAPYESVLILTILHLILCLCLRPYM